MILYPPEHFDINEWFALVSFAVGITISLLLPKRFTTMEVTMYVVFTVFMAHTVDSLIAVSPFDLYDVSDTAKYELTDVFIYYFNYPLLMYLFLYIYDRWQWKGGKRILYLVVATIGFVSLEGLADLCRVFTYKGWKLIYSPLVYAPIFVLAIGFYHYTKSFQRKLSPHSQSGR